MWNLIEIRRRGGARLRLGVLLGLTVLASGVLASVALAGGFDPRHPTTLVVGAPAGFAPSERVDPLRRGQSSTSLPTVPSQVWRRELAGGLEVSPLIDSKGGVIAALVSPDVVRLGSDGQQSWRTRLGGAGAVVAPVLLSDGSVAVVCSDGTLWSIGPGGTTRFTIDLRMRTKKSKAAPLARDDGGLVIAGDSGVVMVAQDGGVVARASLPLAAVGGVLPWRDGVLVTAADGGVHFWQPPAEPRKLGELGGHLEGGAALVGERTLVAVVDRLQVVAFDLLGAGTTVLASGAGMGVELEGPVTLDPRGVLLVTNIMGELFGLDAHGAMVRQEALESLPAGFAADAGMPSIFRRIDTQSSPAPVVDAKGRLAFARNSGKVGVVDESGKVATADTRLCAQPIAVLPAGPKRFAVACRNGSIALYGESGTGG